LSAFIRIKGWEKYQHYKDRNPPWIKLHQELLTSLTWALADDASRVLAIALMMIAAKTGNKTPANPDYVKRVAYLHSLPDFTQLIQLEFIEIIDENGDLVVTGLSALADASKMQAFARPETETETETEHKQRKKKPSPQKPAEVLPQDSWHQRIQAMVKTAWSEHNGGTPCPWGVEDGAQLKLMRSKSPGWSDSQYAQCLSNMYATEGFPRSKLPFEFLPRLCSFLSGPRNEFNREQVNGAGNSKAERRNADISATTREVFGIHRDDAGHVPKALSHKASG